MIHRVSLYRKVHDKVRHQDIGIDEVTEDRALQIAAETCPDWRASITTGLLPVYLPVEVIGFFANAALSPCEFRQLKEACQKVVGNE